LKISGEHRYALPMVPIPEALALVDSAAAERLHVLPLEVTSAGTLVLMAQNPQDWMCADELRALTQRSIELIPSTVGDLTAEIRRAYGFTGKIAELSSRCEEAEQGRESPDLPQDDSPAAGIVDGLIAQAVNERASDIHIEPEERESRVRFRIDGRLIEELPLAKAAHPSVTARIKIMAGMDISEKRLPQDGRIVKEFEGRSLDLRVSTLPTVYGEKTVLRILDPCQTQLGLENLGCTPRDLEKIKELLQYPDGLILNTGPTGSGKTTTLYAMLRRLNLAQYNAVAVEDPVEYHIPGVTQVQVNEKSGLTFGTALRSILRQDPDIILVGEIRDAETAMLAVRAALTGHLVLATVHANDAPSAPFRLVDMGVPPYLLSTVLRGVMAQRLIRKLCASCRQPLSAPDGLAPIIPAGVPIYRAAGCACCSGQGYRGRCALFQVMPVGDEIAALIASGGTSAELRAAAIEGGMSTLRQAALEKVLEGVTGLEEAEAVVGGSFCRDD
jgi:type IV pilus assembly protein PilB